MASNSDESQQASQQEQEEPEIVDLTDDTLIITPAPEPEIVDLTIDTPPPPPQAPRPVQQESSVSTCRKVYDISAGEPDIILCGIRIYCDPSVNLLENYVYRRADTPPTHCPIGTIDSEDSDADSVATASTSSTLNSHPSRYAISEATEIIDPSELDQDIEDLEMQEVENLEEQQN